MSFLIPEAMAADPAPAQGFGFEPMIMLAIFGLIFYFMIWRPQSIRSKEHRNLLKNLSKGDEVISNGGIAGKIIKVTDNFIILEINPGTEVKVQKSAVTTVLPKGTLKAV